jgi:single-strand DNA-binding protein
MATKSLNRATLIGHVGKDAEVRYTGSGIAVATFTVATSDSWKDKNSGQLQEKTEWHNIVAWNRLGEICGEYVKKGKRVYIDGRIQNRSYDDKDGNKRYVSEIVANDLILLDSPSGQGGGPRDGGGYSGSRNQVSAQQASHEPAPAHEFDQSSAVDDLPF